MSFSEGRSYVVMVRNTDPSLWDHVHLSRRFELDRGTPQGTCKGPPNFILCTNDVRDALPEGRLVVYANDTSHLLSHPGIDFE
jgi:hypothetical protein